MRALILLLLPACVLPAGTKPTDETGDPTVSTPTPSPGTLGTTSDLEVDEFFVTVDPVVDVLFVVSTEPGMASFQDDYVGDIQYFLDYLLGGGIDYHLGVVSAGDGGLLVEGSEGTTIDAATVDPLAALDGMMRLGEGGTASAVYGAAYTAAGIERDLGNAAFFRDDAVLHVVALYDGVDDTDPAVITEPDFLAWLDGLVGAPERTAFHCLVPTGASCSAVASDSGGLAWTVTYDLAPPNDALGFEVGGTTRTFALSSIPDPATLVVENDIGIALLLFGPEDWAYDAAENTVSFLEYAPEPESTILISYVPL